MAQPRVCVVGGGIAGTLCSLVLKNRGIHPTLVDAGRSGVGGRLRNGGAQFIRAADPRLATVMGLLEREGLVAQWKGRFGMLGSSGGGFLPAEHVANNMMGMSSNNNEGQEREQENQIPKEGGTPPASDGGDFCQFVEGATVPTYVGIPSMTDLCPKISQLAGIEEINDSKLLGATPLKEGGWNLDVVQNGENGTAMVDPNQKFDALVLATHDPSLASGTIRSIVNAEVKAGGYKDFEEASNAGDDASLIIGRLGEIANNMQRVRDNDRVPVFAVSITLPDLFSKDIPFDAVSIPGSQIVQFLKRDGVNPEFVQSAEAMGGETWTAITTSRLASAVMERPDFTDDDKRTQIAQAVADEVMRLVSRYSTIAKAPEPLEVSAKRWSSAFCSQGLQLKEDSILLAPWRLTVCGDYIRDLSAYATPFEAAALSGLEAGEKTAALWAQEDQ